jgi:hypothetical protein
MNKIIIIAPFSLNKILMHIYSETYREKCKTHNKYLLILSAEKQIFKFQTKLDNTFSHGTSGVFVLFMWPYLRITEIRLQGNINIAETEWVSCFGHDQV